MQSLVHDLRTGEPLGDGVAVSRRGTALDGELGRALSEPDFWNGLGEVVGQKFALPGGPVGR